MKTWIGIGLAALALLVAASSLLVVDETEHAVITNFGRAVAVRSEAGLYAKLPAPFQRVTRLEKRIVFTEQQPTELLTADKKNVVLSTYVSWRIADPLAFLTSLRTREAAEALLAALVQSELGSTLGNLPFSSVVPAGSASAAWRHRSRRSATTPCRCSPCTPPRVWSGTSSPSPGSSRARSPRAPTAARRGRRTPGSATSVRCRTRCAGTPRGCRTGTPRAAPR